MAVGSDETCKAGQKRNRTEDPGVEATTKRIHDSENGKTCHQCRQKTMDFMASCKQPKKDKPCPMNYCHKCLQKRYGEKAEQVNTLEEWICPKCRNICNCSICKKKKGQLPTGTLYRTAKQIGFSSVHDQLDQQGSEHSSLPNILQDSSTLPSDKGLNALKECCHKDEQCVEPEEPRDEDIVLPQGRLLTEVAGVEFPPEDVGKALQFLEFCKSFSEVLDIKKGQPECILRELVKGPGRRRVSSSIVQFHIKLLSLIEEDIKEDDWVQALGRFITESQSSLDKLSVDLFEKGLSGYDSLSQSEKLWILIYLCNEILSTEKLRNWIDEDIAKHSEKMKENKQKVLALKKEEKLLNQKLSNDMAQVMISTIGRALLPPSELKAAISQIRNKADQELAELLKSIEQLHTEKQRPLAAGTSPIFLEGTGHAYWKLSYNSNSNIMLQDIGTWDSVSAVDKWYLFNEDEEKEVENHIYSARNLETKSHKQAQEDIKGAINLKTKRHKQGQENSSDDIKGAINLKTKMHKQAQENSSDDIKAAINLKTKRHKQTKENSSDDIKGAINLTGDSNLTGSSTLSCAAQDKVARLVAIMEMRASK